MLIFGTQYEWMIFTGWGKCKAGFISILLNIGCSKREGAELQVSTEATSRCCSLKVGSKQRFQYVRASILQTKQCVHAHTLPTCHEASTSTMNSLCLMILWLFDSYSIFFIFITTHRKKVLWIKQFRLYKSMQSVCPLLFFPFLSSLMFLEWNEESSL